MVQDFTFNWDIYFLQKLLGIQYTNTSFANLVGFDSFKISLEGSNEGVYNQHKVHEYVLDSEDAHIHANNIVAAVLAQANSKFFLVGGADFDYRYHGRAYLAGFRYYKTDDLFIQLNDTIFGGSEDSPFGTFRRNSNIAMQIDYTF